MISSNKTKGFTLVELLIVIVVIAILAAISIAAYNGVSNKARDGERQPVHATLSTPLPCITQKRVIGRR